MTDIFLKAKHWQIFLLTFGLPLIYQFTWFGSMMFHLATQSDPDPMVMFSYVKFFPLFMVLFMFVFFGWLWSIAIGLQKKVPENVTMKVKKFKVFFFFPLIYFLLFLTAFTATVSGFISPDLEQGIGFFGGIFAVVVPLHLFSMFCIFYSLYFVSKTFKTVELQKEVKFADFAGEFFMIWFYPVGIWIIQPKINKMIEEYDTNIQ